MKKRFLLKTLYETGTNALLSGDELRLYVLLLAAADNNGRGVIPCRVLTEALGPLTPPGRLTFMCRRLEELGLIQLHGSPITAVIIGYRLKEPVPVPPCPTMEPAPSTGNGDPHGTK